MQKSFKEIFQEEMNKINVIDNKNELSKDVQDDLLELNNQISEFNNLNSFQNSIHSIRFRIKPN